MSRAVPRWPPSPAQTLGISKTSQTNSAPAQTVGILVIRTPNEGSDNKKQIKPKHVCFLAAADPQETRTVEFTKGPSDTLGISIAGGVGSPLGDIPIFIAMMNPVGLAAQTQKLKV